tara:strand:+ start:596 stop:892 length:297 start_codon:yes stop_codon:yes gene_type:complete
MWDSLDEAEYNDEQKDKFIEDIFEIAFGETKLKDELLEEKGYQTVIAKIMEFSDNALKWEEAYPTLFQQFQKSLDLDIEEDYQLDERLDQFKKELSDD